MTTPALPPRVKKAGAFDEDGVFRVAKIAPFPRGDLSPLMGDRRFATVRDLWITWLFGRPDATIVKFLSQPWLKNLRRLGGIPSTVFEKMPRRMPWTDVSLWDTDGLDDLVRVAPELRTLRFPSEHVAAAAVGAKWMEKIVELGVTPNSAMHLGKLMTAVAKSRTARKLEVVEIGLHTGWTLRFVRQRGSAWSLRLACARPRRFDPVAYVAEMLAGIPVKMMSAWELVLPRALEPARGAIEALLPVRPAVTRSR